MLKKKIFIIAYIIITLLVIKLFYNMILNKILISKYNDGEYSEKIAYALTLINYPEGYVAYYNCGNILYQNGDYDGAIEQYKKALKNNIPKRKECSIRINYALSICANVHVDEENKESIESAIEMYKEAVEVLVEDNCANDDGDGHSKKAQKLKDDIEEEIKRLEKLLEEENKDEDKKDDDDKKDDNEEQNKNNEIEDKIKDIKDNATKEQREKENSGKNVRKENEW